MNILAFPLINKNVNNAKPVTKSGLCKDEQSTDSNVDGMVSDQKKGIKIELKLRTIERVHKMRLMNQKMKKTLENLSKMLTKMRTKVNLIDVFEKRLSIEYKTTG